MLQALDFGKLVLALALVLPASGCVVKTEDSDSNIGTGKCGMSTEQTPGELGVLKFAYDRGAIGCMFGCGATEPLGARSKARFAVYSDTALPAVSVSSTDEAVAKFDITNTGRIAITTGAPGTAKLEIKDASGTLIDALPVVVKSVSTIRADKDESLAIMTGGAVSVNLTLEDENGCALMGLGGVDYQLSGGISKGEVTILTQIVDWLLQPVISSMEESFTLNAQTVGAGSVEISAPSGATATLPVEVVDEASVAKVSLDVSDDLESGEMFTAEASAFTSDERRVYSPKCTWTLSPETGPITIKSSTRDTALIKSDTPAEAELTCTIAGVSGSAPIVYGEKQ